LSFLEADRDVTKEPGESYLSRQSWDGSINVVVAKTQFDDKAANFLAAFPSTMA
jgi:hypothetical protein